jgi:glycogen operon protein
VEGPTERPEIIALRARQLRNLAATLLLSQGVPMLLSGDECRRTQRGNNNAWCQDNPLSWFDWDLVGRHADLVRFVHELVRFRLENPTLRRRSFLQGGTSGTGALPDVEWFSADGVHIDWYAADCSLTCVFGAPTRDALLAGDDLAAGGIDGVPRHVMVIAHAGSLPRSFRFPESPAVRALAWRVFVQTAMEPPHDVLPDGTGPLVDVERPLELAARSLVCLVADPVSEPAPSVGRRRIARSGG